MPRIARFALLAAALLATALPSAAQSLAGGPSSRPWAAIGRLTIDGQFVCTATLISATQILTAAHCVLDDDGAPYAAPRIGFQAGVEGNTAVLVRDIAGASVHPGYAIGTFSSVEKTATDIAVLDLSWPVAEFEILPIPVGRYAGEREGLFLPIYSVAHASFLRINRGCDVDQLLGPVLELTCLPDEGASGAPLIVGRGPMRRVVAVLSNASGGFSPRSYAVRTDLGLAGLARRP